SCLACSNRSACDGIGQADLVLHLQQAVNQSLSSRRAAWHVHIYRHDAITAANDRVGVVVVTATVGTGAHGDDPAWLGHLVVHLTQGGCHLVAQGARHNHQVRLTWAGTENNAELVQVITSCTSVHHFHCTTGQTKCHGPHGPCFCPVQKLVCTGRHKTFFENAVDSHSSCLLPDQTLGSPGLSCC